VHDRVVVEDRVVVRPGQLVRRGEDLPPALDLEVERRQQRGDQQADGRDEPEDADDDQRDIDGRLAENAQDLAREALLDDRRTPLSNGLGRGGHGYASLLKRRMLRSSTGITRMKMKTAIAEPRPNCAEPANAVRHIASARTFASDCVDSGAMEMMMSNTLRTLISIVTKTTVSTGASSGTVTRRNTCHSLAPSVRAASSTSRGMAASPAAITTIENPAQIQM